MIGGMNAKAPHADRLRSLRQSFETHQIDALLVTDEINVGYLSGFTGDSSYLLVGTGEATLLSDRRYETQIAQECPDLAAAVRPPSQSMPDLLAEVLAGSCYRRVGVESSSVTLAQWDAWQDRLADASPSIQWVPTAGVVEALRQIKDEFEIGRIRQSIDIAERAYVSVTSRLTSRMTEREVAHDLESVMRTLGASGVSFEPIVGAQPSGALPHYRPDAVPLGDAPTLLIDWGAFYQGYASDLTRTLHRDAASDAFRRAYDVVLAAQLAAIERIGNGVAASDVDAAARNVIEAAGMGDAFKHGLGHGIGLQIHESPRMASVSPQVLSSGMVVTVEPGVYFEGEFGIRIEDDVLVTDSGCEVLTRLPKGLDDCRLIL